MSQICVDSLHPPWFLLGIARRGLPVMPPLAYKLMNCSSIPNQSKASYPLVNIQKAIENGPVEIVDFPINSMVDLSIAKC